MEEKVRFEIRFTAGLPGHERVRSRAENISELLRLVEEFTDLWFPRNRHRGRAFIYRGAVYIRKR